MPNEVKGVENAISTLFPRVASVAEFTVTVQSRYQGLEHGFLAWVGSRIIVSRTGCSG